MVYFPKIRPQFENISIRDGTSDLVDSYHFAGLGLVFLRTSGLGLAFPKSLKTRTQKNIFEIKNEAKSFQKASSALN